MDVEPFLESGQLSILSVKESYLMGEEGFDPGGMIALLKTETERALGEGYSALRVTGEMSWAAGDLPGSERLIEYESKLNNFFPDSQCLAMCQYDRRRFSAELLLDVLITHPFVIIGTEVYDNFCYMEPEDFLGPDLPGATLKHRIDAFRTQKRINEAFRESESRLTDAQKLAHLGSYEFEVLEGEVIWSEETFRIVGRDPSLGEPTIEEFMEIVHPDERSRVLSDVERAINKKQPFDMEYRVVLGDGQIKHIHSIGQPVLDESGTTVKMFGTILDITGRKRAEEALHKATEEWELTFNTMRDGVSIHDSDMNIILANKSLGKLLGSSPEELVGRKCYHAFHDCSEPIKDCPMERCMLSESPEYIEFFEPTINSWLSISLTPFPNDRGDVEKFVHVARDITNRKRAEEELKRSRDHLEKLHNSLGDPVFSVEFPERLIDYANHSVEAVFGYTPEECIGKTTEMLYSEKKDYLAFGRKIKKALEQNEDILHIEQVMKRKNREAFPVEVTASFLREDSKVTRVISIVRDITERKRAEQELKNLNEHLEERVKERTHELALASEELIRKEKLATLGQLSGSIAHEIRNPLGVIGNSAYYLKMKLKDADEKVKRHLDIMQSAVLRTNVIISDLLNFSQGSPPSLVKGGVSEIIKDALKETDLPEDVKVETSFGSDLPEAIFDPNQLQQVFFNLISNAVRAMPDGGTLKITTRAKGDFIEAKVSDTGKGIPKENLEKIFEPLFTTMTTGTGLGLAIVKGILDKHNGKIEVNSREGKGTTFTVKLPRCR